MAYLESHQELGRHPKTRKAARLLGISRPAVVGHLQYLWWWALDFAQDGDLTDYDAADIADAAEWEGDPDAFITSLIDACAKDGSSGFLERTEDGRLLIHDWEDYGGKLIVKRREDAQRKRDSRYSDGKSTSAGCPPDVQRTAQVDKTRQDKTNVEKRIEEKTRQDETAREVAVSEPTTESVAAAPADSSSSSSPVRPSSLDLNQEREEESVREIARIGALRPDYLAEAERNAAENLANIRTSENIYKAGIMRLMEQKRYDWPIKPAPNGKSPPKSPPKNEDGVARENAAANRVVTAPEWYKDRSKPLPQTH